MKDIQALPVREEAERFGWKERVLLAAAVTWVWLLDIGSRLLESLSYGWVEQPDESEEE